MMAGYCGLGRPAHHSGRAGLGVRKAGHSLAMGHCLDVHSPSPGGSATADHAWAWYPRVTLTVLSCPQATKPLSKPTVSLS